MLSFVHKLVSIPAVYELGQWVAGGPKNRKIFRQEFSTLPPQGRVLDVGGGTGLLRPLFPNEWEYCCLDTDPQMLKAFRAKFPQNECIEASACNIPFADGRFDLCLMKSVSHHLTEAEFQTSLLEVKRVLSPQGILILVDPTWNPTNFRGRFLWSVDRGSFPRTEQALQEHLARHFMVERKRSWRVHHEYALFWCLKP